MRHLIMYTTHDESEAWCAAPSYWRDGDATEKPEEADCVKCLEAAMDFGTRARHRLSVLT